jgi:molybdenum cofactor cytidylyltransferase
MASTLKRGMAEIIAQGADHALIALGDMPALRAEHIAALLNAVRDEPHAVIRAAHGDSPGNPVILPSHLFAAVMELNGDCGARQLIDRAGVPVSCVDIGPAATLDIDDADALARYRDG